MRKKFVPALMVAVVMLAGAAHAAQPIELEATEPVAEGSTCVQEAASRGVVFGLLKLAQCVVADVLLPAAAPLPIATEGDPDDYAT